MAGIDIPLQLVAMIAARLVDSSSYIVVTLLHNVRNCWKTSL